MSSVVESRSAQFLRDRNSRKCWPFTKNPGIRPDFINHRKEGFGYPSFARVYACACQTAIPYTAVRPCVILAAGEGCHRVKGRGVIREGEYSNFMALKAGVKSSTLIFGFGSISQSVGSSFGTHETTLLPRP